MDPIFRTAKERDAYHAQFKSMDWKKEIDELKAARTRQRKLSAEEREQERVNRILDLSPMVKPLNYATGEIPDESKGYVARDGYIRRPSARDHANKP